MKKATANDGEIVIRDAYENNLKHIDVQVPLNAFTCVTGCSGCGKSSLVFDTIYAESQRGFWEGFAGSFYNQKLMDKPKVGSIENLRPALNISQNYYNVNPRSSVGTVTEISYYLRSLFAVVNSDDKHSVKEGCFSSNNPTSFCPHCMGLGVENTVSVQRLIPDEQKRLEEGGILFYKGGVGGKEYNMLQAFCEHYGIDIAKRVCDLSAHEKDLLLNSVEKVRYKLSYREGRRRKTHYVFLQGVVPAINEKIKSMGGQSAVYAKYMEEVPCSVCGGSKLSTDILKYEVDGLNYFEVESLELSDLAAWFRDINLSKIPNGARVAAEQLIEIIQKRLRPLIKLDVGYLSLGRTIPSLSGGERQRIRIASQLNCTLQGILYILDEPCKGLHFRDVKNIVAATQSLVNNGNTVVAIEHNKQYIDAADHVIELGPVGGPKGGYLVSQGRRKLSKCLGNTFKEGRVFREYIELIGICFRNIKDQAAKVPKGGICCVVGVSGSGKSSFAAVLRQCVDQKNAIHCKTASGVQLFKRVVSVNQSPIGKTPRSTIASYLEIFDDIRELFAMTNFAKKKKLAASDFSVNVKGGRCECCQGTGLQKIELTYLPSLYVKCPSCNGRRYSSEILLATYGGLNIQEVLDSPIEDIVEIFVKNERIHVALKNMMRLGLGYLKLGQMSMNLSGGEAQRIKLAKALSVSSTGNNLYILDEPTSGLNDADIARFEDVLKLINENHETIVIVEHNVGFVARMADFVIDFGIRGGKDGGRIVAQGLTGDVFRTKESSLFGSL